MRKDVLERGVAASADGCNALAKTCTLWAGGCGRNSVASYHARWYELPSEREHLIVGNVNVRTCEALRFENIKMKCQVDSGRIGNGRRSFEGSVKFPYLNVTML